MSVPTVKFMVERGFDETKAKEIRNLMRKFVEKATTSMVTMMPRITMQKINDIIGGSGVEEIKRGKNEKSPAIIYVNMGDPYSTTVMYVKRKFVIGCWGPIVEKGNYE